MACGQSKEPAAESNANALQTPAKGPAAKPAQKLRTQDGYDVIVANRTQPGPERSTDEQAKKDRERAHFVLIPTSPDPDADFTLEQSVEGLGTDGTLVAEIWTDLGVIYCDLYADKTPKTVANFIGLARGLRSFWDARAGAWVKRPYYGGTEFYRIIPGFGIQGGDHLNDGTGEVGYALPAETYPGMAHDRAGQLVIANPAGSKKASQFFITDSAARHLDATPGYTVFGRCSPESIVSSIARVPQHDGNRPLSPIEITRLKIRRVVGGAAVAKPIPPVMRRSDEPERRGASPGPTELNNPRRPPPAPADYH